MMFYARSLNVCVCAPRQKLFIILDFKRSPDGKLSLVIIM